MGWGSAIALYILEHGVVEFGGSIQRDPRKEETMDGGQNHTDNNYDAINKLVEVQVWVV